MTPLDLRLSFGPLRVGGFDPTSSISDGAFAKAFFSEAGKTLVVVESNKGEIRVDGTDAISVNDGYGDFAPAHPLVKKLHRSLPGLRVVRVPWLFDIGCAAILEQRVTTREAMREWRRIVTKHGEPLGELRAFPSAERLASLPSWELESLGVDPKRARTMIGFARAAFRRRILDTQSPEELRKRLLSLPGIGSWTTEMVMAHGFGDPDALLVGDLHLPHLVTWAFAREPWGTDARMQELLLPFRGQRHRVTRLLGAAGIHVPRSPRPSSRS